MFKKSLMILSCLISSILFSQNITNYSELESFIRNQLFAKGYIVESQFNAVNNISIFGFNNKIFPTDSLKNGIYRAQAIASHNIPCFVILENENVKFLDIYSFDNVQKSIHEILSYSLEQNYCKEIAFEYLGSLISRHYFNIEYSSLRRDIFCDYPEEINKSNFNLINLKELIVENISVNERMNNKIEVGEIYISKTNSRFEISEIEILDNGIYSYSHFDSSGLTNYYFILQNNNMKFLKLEDEKSFIESVNEIILFGKENQVCYIQTLRILEKVFDNYFQASCLDLLVDNLP